MQRLGPPHWPAYPPGAAYGRVYDRDRRRGSRRRASAARLIASDLAALGIDVDCLPLADVPVAGADQVIGDRAYGTTPGQGRRDRRRGRGRACSPAACYRCSSTFPAMGAPPPTATCGCRWWKPTARPWRRPISPHSGRSDLPMAMTAHVVFTALDPVAPATTSGTMVHRNDSGSSGSVAC